MSSAISRVLHTAGLLFLISCAVTNILIYSSAYKLIPSLLGVLICTLPITLPISYFLWSVPFIQFQAATKNWTHSEYYRQEAYSVQGSRLINITYSIAGEGSEFERVTLAPGRYQIDAESPAGEEIRCELYPDPESENFIHLFTSQGTYSTGFTVNQTAAGYIHITPYSPATRWKLSLKTPEPLPPPILGEEPFEPSLSYFLREVGDHTGKVVHLPLGHYDLSWYTPYSHIQITLVDAAGQQPDRVLVHRTRKNGRRTYTTEPLQSKPIYIHQQGDYRFKVTMLRGSRDGKWWIGCSSVVKPGG